MTWVTDDITRSDISKYLQTYYNAHTNTDTKRADYIQPWKEFTQEYTEYKAERGKVLTHGKELFEEYEKYIDAVDTGITESIQVQNLTDLIEYITAEHQHINRFTLYKIVYYTAYTTAKSIQK